MLKVELDIVVHLASFIIRQHKSQDVEQLINSNILFSSQLLEAMVHNKIKKFINTGTIWQYANNQTYNPLNLYTARKQAFEDIVDYYVQHQNINTITLRLSNTYGIGDPHPRIINLLLDLEKSGKTLDMTTGKQLLSFVHINDVISAYDCALKEISKSSEKIIHRKYSVTTEKAISLQDLVNLFQKIRGTSININWGKLPHNGLGIMEELWTLLPSSQLATSN